LPNGARHGAPPARWSRGVATDLGRGSRSGYCDPSNPYDAKRLLISSIRDDNPVLFFENEVLYAIEGDVLEERLTTFCAVPILSLLSQLVA
jgi:hypothetical protein